MTVVKIWFVYCKVGSPTEQQNPTHQHSCIEKAACSDDDRL